MGDLGRIDIEKFISYSHDLYEVLKNKKDANNLLQCLEGCKKLQSFCEAESNEVESLLEEYEKKIDACKQRIEVAKGEVSSEDLDSLESELQQELQKQHSVAEELRIVNDQIHDLELQRVSVEDQKKTLMKCVKDVLKNQRKLSVEHSALASITNIIPNTDDQTKVSGHIVGRDKKLVEKFEFEPAKSSSFETCNNLWKMIDL